MKRLFILLIIGTIAMNAQDFSTFNKYFEDATMRVDYYHVGDSESEIFTIDHIYQQGIWAGSRIHTIDKFNNGTYYLKVYDKSSGELIYSKGFDSYFKEYQTSAKALKGIKRSYHETALFPYPKAVVKVALEKRNDRNELIEIYSTEIDPNDISIIKENVVDAKVEVTKSLYNGDPHSKADIVIVAEGYTIEERDKYLADLKHFTEVFINTEPYKSNKEKFNIYGVFKPSEESGVDEPRAGIYKNTTLNATFNSLGSERYMLTEDNKTLRNLAAHVPYDAIYIMANHYRYGGGGIYNWASTFTTDGQFRDYIFTHEFGHSFSGLADEYYTSSTAYDENFFSASIEPVEPNITAMHDSENLKWKDLVSEGVELPTRWEKKDFDEMDYAWQKRRAELNDKIAELKRNKASKEEIQKAEDYYAEQDKLHSDKVDKYLAESKYAGKVGAFEGAGYMPTGLYRPMLDCIMFSKGNKPFCKVCQNAIERVINHYTE